MNVLTYKAAYSFFPNETFEKRRNVCFAGRDIISPDAIEKYTLRGWPLINDYSLAHDARDAPTKNRTLRLRQRWVGDSDTWIFPFDTAGLESRLGAEVTDLPVPISIDPLSLNSFNIKENINGTILDYDTIDRPYFNNRYIGCPEFVVKLTTLFSLLKVIIKDTPSLTLSKR